MRVLAILLAVAELAAMLLAAVFALFSVMLFDAPGSTDTPAIWAAFWASWALPPAFFVGAGFAIAAAIRFTRLRLLVALLLPGAVMVWLVVALAALS